MSSKLLQQFYNRLGRDLSLPSHAIGVFDFLLFKAKDDGTAIYPTMETIARCAGIQLRQAQYTVRYLENEGFIVSINRQGGRSRLPLWHVPLDQEGYITPKPLASAAQVESQGQPDRRGQKQRPVKLVPIAPPGDNFLDVDQAEGRGRKEIEEYHQAHEEYQAGYTPRALPALRLVPQPGAPVVVTEVPALTEVEQAQIEIFQSTLGSQINTKRAELAEKRDHLAALTEKIGKTRFEGSRKVLQNLKTNVEGQVGQLQAELEELEELASQQIERQIL